MDLANRINLFLGENASDILDNIANDVHYRSNRSIDFQTLLADIISLENDSVILIDEIELHLHPYWQQRVFEKLLKMFPNTQFCITTHSPFIVETLNNHLKKHTIKHKNIDDPEIDRIEPLSPEETNAFLVKDGQLYNIMDKELGLIDNKLITYFNNINSIYDKIRNIEEYYESKNRKV